MKKFLIVITFIIILLSCVIGLYYFENYEDKCYTKIDNNKIKKLSSKEDMKYEYSLTCIKENGKEKNIKFKTSRELRNDAYLLLELRIMGVHSWSEVEYEELPSKVKPKIDKNV